MDFKILKIKENKLVASFIDEMEAIKFLCSHASRDFLMIDEKNKEKFISDCGFLIKIE